MLMNTYSHTHAQERQQQHIKAPESLYKSCSKVEESSQNTTHSILPKHCTDLRKHRQCYIFTQASAECC